MGLLSDYPRDKNITEVVGLFGSVVLFLNTDAFHNPHCLKTLTASKVRTNFSKLKVISQPKVVFTIFRHFPVHKAKDKT